MGTWAIVVAAGKGTRFGGPKQYEVVAGRRVLDWAVAGARSVSEGVVVVVDPGRAAQPEPLADVVVEGGATRSASVRAGLAAVPEDAGLIVVHDAARPCASAALFAAVVAEVEAGAEAAVPGLPVVDTVKRIDPEGVVQETLDRATLVGVQTPQAFAAAALRAAHRSRADASDDAALIEAAGGRVVVVTGETANIKLTEAGDLAAAEAHLGLAAGSTVARSHVGLGFDVHPYSDDPDRALVLGGVMFREERGLAGHSDADVVVHAVADALLGAAGLDDLGTHFPDTDPAWAGADSLVLLARVVQMMRSAGWEPANVDCAVVLDAPRLAPKRPAMEAELSGVVGAPVSVKGRRPEGLGSLGRGEGVACWTVALVNRSAPR